MHSSRTFFVSGQAQQIFFLAAPAGAVTAPATATGGKFTLVEATVALIGEGVATSVVLTRLDFPWLSHRSLSLGYFREKWSVPTFGEIPTIREFLHFKMAHPLRTQSSLGAPRVHELYKKEAKGRA
jgi:hypothetical protein